MTEVLKKFDRWLDDAGPPALVMREHLVPVEGKDGVFFPATFAASEDKTFKGGYSVDEFPGGAGNVCLVDSVGSQANRIEPLFGRTGYSDLVPQVVVEAGDTQVNLLDAGHRAADAIMRCSALGEELDLAFDALRKGNAGPLARIAPTSLVFGVWDSRGSHARLPRLVASTVRAWNVQKLTRAAQFVPATEYVQNGLLDEPTDKATRDAYSERGFAHVPSSGAPGGVIATAGIRRDVTLHLAALRRLAGEDGERTTALRRYVLGLALTAFTYTPSGFYRQGCSLVPDVDHEKPREVNEVACDGRRTALSLTHEAALEYAKAAAKAFGVGGNRRIPFLKERAVADLAGKEARKGRKASADSGQETKPPKEAQETKPPKGPRKKG